MQHLVDAERLFGFRLRACLYEERPRLAMIDQDRWVAGQARGATPVPELVDEFETLRDLNLVKWRALTDDELARTGFHEAAGVELSLETLRRILAGHDLWHCAQIERDLAATARA